MRPCEQAAQGGMCLKCALFPDEIPLGTDVLHWQIQRQVEIRHQNFRECVHIYTHKHADTMATILSLPGEDYGMAACCHHHVCSAAVVLA